MKQNRALEFNPDDFCHSEAEVIAKCGGCSTRTIYNYRKEAGLVQKKHFIKKLGPRGFWYTDEAVVLMLMVKNSK